MNDEVRVAVAEPALLGESPVWHAGEQVLYYVDIAGHRLLRFDPAEGRLERWQFDTEIGSIAPLDSGGWLLAMRDGLWRFDTGGGERELVKAAPYDPAHERFNDGKCDPQGRFWVGTVYEPRTPALASLYCYRLGRLERRAGDATVSNGLAWSPDGRTMYWSDTPSHTIWSFDFDPHTGTMGERRVFARFEGKQAGQDLDRYGGSPDGGAVDAEGCYWAAMYEGQRLLRLSPAGEVLRELPLPVRCPTMPCFGGPELRTLYITTARERRPAEELAAQPAAGCVLAIDVDVPGVPVASCAA